MSAWPKHVSVVAGRPFEIKAEAVTGNPKPTVTWVDEKGQDVSRDPRMRPEKFLKSLALKCVESKRGDSGNYTLKLTNENGSVEATCKVTVFGW